MAAERAVVVGAGSISGAWFPALAAEGVQVPAVVDLDIERARKRIAEFKLDAEAATSMRNMVRRYKPDFVIDLTVPEAHCGVTCTALKMGCHVIGEKPMAATMSQARRMVATADKCGKLYMVSQSRRWNAMHQATRDLIAAGKIGALTALNCDFFMGCHFGGFRDEMPSPLVLDMAIHHFDLARMLSAADPVAVYAREFNPAGSWYKGDAAASCIFEMTGGVVFTYRGSWCAEGFHTSWNGDWRIIGQRGTIIMEKDQPPRGQVVAGDAGFNRPLADITVPEPKMEFTGMHGALREMLAFIRTGAKPQTECHDNIKSLAMVLAAIESSRKERRVPVRA
ncbi:MAG: Gfo/Idh/MocA family protein [Phycisphaerae bacterium]